MEVLHLLYFTLLFISLLAQPKDSTFNSYQLDGITMLQYPNLSRGIFNSFAYTYNPQTHSFYLFENHSGRLLEITKHDEVKILDTLNFPFSTTRHVMETLRNGEEIYFWEHGLGQVYKYDLKNKKLNHISNTFVDKLMFSHGAFVDSDDIIYAQGGYGFWQKRNYLLKFDPNRKEWLLESYFIYDQEETSPSGIFNYVWKDLEGNRIFYLSELENEWLGEKMFNISSYSLTDRVWKNEKWFKPVTETDVDERNPEYRSPYVDVKSTYRRDDSSKVSHLFGSLFFDEKTFSFKRFISQNNFDSDITNYVFLFSTEKNEWIRIGYDGANSILPTLIIQRIPADNLPLIDVESRNFLQVAIKKYYGLVVLVFVSFVGFFGFMQLKRRKLQPVPELFMLSKEDANVRVKFKKEPIQISDDLLLKSWELIYSLKEIEQTHIPITEFDQKVFNDSHSGSFKSKKRKEILKQLNLYTKSPLISTVINSLDKRYKDLQVDLSQIEIS